MLIIYGQSYGMANGFYWVDFERGDGVEVNLAV
jgi:hypothetical protein